MGGPLIAFLSYVEEATDPVRIRPLTQDMDITDGELLGSIPPSHSADYVSAIVFLDFVDAGKKDEDMSTYKDLVL